ncbi:MAG: ABC transporter permease, partial [Eubacteriales bacterium]|nr:ABC transporter permease [Eubacteriales bacterium]
MNRWYFFDSLRMVLRNLAAARLRVWLTVVGIAFGTAALIAVLSIGQGGSRRVQMEMEDIGIRRIWLYPSEQTAAPFGYADAQGLARQLDGQAYVSAAKEVRCTVKAGEFSTEPVLIATQYTLPQMENLDFEQGRFFTEYEQDAQEKVAVLEKTLATVLFPTQQQVVGKKVTIGANEVTVVGVVKKRTPRSDDGMLYLSVDLYEHWYGSTLLDYISVVPAGERSVESVELLGKAALQSAPGVKVRSQTLRDEQDIADNVLSILR